MTYHRFAVLTEQGDRGVKTAEFEDLFAPEVKMYSPFLVKPVEGKSLTLQFMTEAFTNSGYPTYTHQFTDEHTVVLLWKSHSHALGYEVDGAVQLTFSEDGRIIALKGFLRPLQVAHLLREFLFASAGSKLSDDYWKASPTGFAGDPSLLKHPDASPIPTSASLGNS
ncbi:MAG TPA: nuclear transport factor 2 family protein [Ktedonobacteraceae bacterium]|jgi:hypothetical protein